MWAAGNYQPGVQSHWQNVDRFDANNDGVVAPGDALALINDFHLRGERVLYGYPQAGDIAYQDVSGDSAASVLDIDQLIDKLNGGSASSARGRYSPTGFGASANQIAFFLTAGET